MEQIIITGKDFNKIRKEIRENQGKKQVVFTSSDDELNRKVLEKEKIDILLIPLKDRKDKQKQRDSGFNQVLAKTAQKKHVSIGINLDELISANPKNKIDILARVSQNIKTCNKNKVHMAFIQNNKKDSYDLKALGSALGMPTWMLKH